MSSLFPCNLYPSPVEMFVKSWICLCGTKLRRRASHQELVAVLTSSQYEVEGVGSKNGVVNASCNILLCKQHSVVSI